MKLINLYINICSFLLIGAQSVAAAGVATGTAAAAGATAGAASALTGYGAVASGASTLTSTFPLLGVVALIAYFFNSMI